MLKYPILNFPEVKIQLFRSEKNILIFCPIRKKRLVLTPEEWVRQHLIAYLIEKKKYPVSRISVEKSIQYNTLKKRWDIAVFDANFMPYLLIECKAPSINVKGAISQVATYQNVFRGKYFSVSNGFEHVIVSVRNNEGIFDKLSDFPDFNF